MCETRVQEKDHGVCEDETEDKEAVYISSEFREKGLSAWKKVFFKQR